MLRINEAIARANREGKKVKKKEISARLWPDSTVSGQQVNMTALCTGVTKYINPDWIPIVCEMTGCSAEFLLGMKNE